MLNRFLIIVFMLLAQVAYSQNTGYAGKRFILRTDVINGIKSPLFSANVEYLFARRMSFSIGYRYISYKTNQNYTPDEYATYYNGRSYQYHQSSTTSTPMYYDMYKNAPTIKDRASVKSNLFSIEYKFYFPHPVPAPFGLFMYAKLSAGISSVSGNYYESLVKDIDTHVLDANYHTIYGADKYHTYHYKGLVSSIVEVGVGYNRFITKNVFIGARSAITVGTFSLFHPSKASSPGSREILSSISKTYGPNLVNTYDGVSNTGAVTFTPGLSIYAQVGILLF